MKRRLCELGGKIYIKPQNRGKFTSTMKRTGKTAEELSHSSNPLTRKRAVFALNARKWNKAEGGGIASDLLGVSKDVDEVLSYVPIAGSAEDIYTAYKNPTVGNILWALGSTGLDVMGAKLLGNGLKAGYKGLKALYKLNKTQRAYKKLNNANKAIMNQSRYMTIANKVNNADIKRAKRYASQFADNQVKDATLNYIQNNTK